MTGLSSVPSTSNQGNWCGSSCMWARKEFASANPQDGICIALMQRGDDRSLVTAGSDMATPRVKKQLPSRDQYMTDWDIVMDGPAGTCAVDGVEMKVCSKRTRGHVA